jgi:hypothetical protein
MVTLGEQLLFQSQCLHLQCQAVQEEAHDSAGKHTVVLQNIMTYSPDDTRSHAITTGASATLL